MATEFTIDDVNAWLACSREAGKKVWMDSNFYQAMTFKGIEIFPSYFKDVEKKNLHIQLHQSNFDLLQESYFIVFELQDNMKRKHKEGRKVYDFTDRSKFISYVKISVSGALVSAVVKHLKTAFKETVNLDNAERLQIIKDNKCVEDNIDTTNGANYKMVACAAQDSEEWQQPKSFDENKHSEEEVDYDNDPYRASAIGACRESAEKLLETFQKYQELTPALKRFLFMMSECSADLGFGQLGMIALIEKRHEHLSFLEEIKKRQGNAFKQNTYNSYMRRLEILWREFLESEEGKGMYEEFVGRYKACFH